MTPDVQQVNVRTRGLQADISTGLFLISLTCGLIDATCFLALGGVFAEMMTGNLLLIGLSLAPGGEAGHVADNGWALLAFSAGAVACGIRLRRPRQNPAVRSEFLFVWLAVVVAATLTTIVDPLREPRVAQWVVVLLACGMGIQTVLVRRFGVPDLATNVMTLTWAGIMADARLFGGDGNSATRRLLSIGMFFAGAGLGAVLLAFGPHWPLWTAVAVYTAALPSLLRGERQPD
ncbi:MAG: YoaK family protein [Steroidobacteraceae bacterium]